jgi:hypothetical protein
MHSSRELRSSSFEITVGGREVRLVELFDGFGEHDRLGVVIRRPCGAVGASALITAFYDLSSRPRPGFLRLSRLLSLPRREATRGSFAPRHLAEPQGGCGAR